jgi:Immunity protein 50
MNDIPGASEVVAWFGEWPSFHDAEVLSLHINRGETSVMRLRVSKRGNALDSNGRFVREREAEVTFEFREIRLMQLHGEDVDSQNVIAALLLDRRDHDYRIDLSPSYGIGGYFVVGTVSVHLVPLRT